MSDATKATTPSARRDDGDDTLPGIPDATDETGPARFGRYRVVAPLGEGGMGAVYACMDEALEREVAVKSIRVPRGVKESVRAMLVERFEREGRLLASLSHPNVVRVHDVGRESGEPFLVMERVRGPSLRERIARTGPLSARDAARLGAELAGALEAAHAAGILHRDVKPANVLDAEGAWILADFGVARAPESQLTRVGQFLGTPGYASPEALLEGAFSEASDVYGWGATLFSALTGRAPHGERGVMTVAEAQKSGPPALPASALREVPAELAATIRAALDPDPRARPTARQLRERLAREPKKAPILLAATGGAALLAGSMIGLLAGALVWGGDATAPIAPPTIAPVVSPSLAERTAPPTATSEEDYRRRWRAIADDVNAGRYEQGRRKLDELIARYPDDEPAHDLLNRLDEYEEAAREDHEP